MTLRILTAICLLILAACGEQPQTPSEVRAPEPVPASAPAPAMAPAAAPAAAAAISVDRTRIVATSAMRLGFTHTHKGLDEKGADPAAVARGTAALAGLGAFQNTHIMGWGVGNPNPAKGVYNWDSLDRRMAMARQLGGEQVITLCTAPGWMKAGGKDWEMEKRVLPEHVDAFADLCLEVAKRYPDVRIFQVWNEFKGFWSREANDWDVAAYTGLYNAVYDRLKAHDPGLRVGGFYMVAEGSDALSAKPDAQSYGGASGKPLSPRNRASLAWWLEHKHGADFVCLDRGAVSFHDKNTYTTEQVFALQHTWRDIGEQVRGMTQLPLWWSEYYGGAKLAGAEQAGLFAEMYRNMVLGGSAVALLWNPIEGEVAHGLVSPLDKADGGQPTPHHAVFSLFTRHFAAGAELFDARCSDPRIGVLASPGAVLAVNRSTGSVAVAFPSGRRVELAAFTAAWEE